MVLNHSSESCLHQVWKSKPALCGFCDSHKNFAKSGVLLHDESRWSTLFSHVLWNGHTTHVAHVALDMLKSNIYEHLWTSMNFHVLSMLWTLLDRNCQVVKSRHIHIAPLWNLAQCGAATGDPAREGCALRTDQVSTQCNSLHAVPNCTFFFMSSTNALSANKKFLTLWV